MKKLFLSLIIILVFAGTAFYFGWTSFAVPLGAYGVLTSKTGGVSEQVIENGRFSWNWERLLPTNARLTVFTALSREVLLSGSGTLPSGELYAITTEGNPDFSWKITGSVSVRLNPSLLPTLIREGIEDQASLNAWIGARVSTLADSAIREALSEAISGELAKNGGITDPALMADRIQMGLLESSGGDFTAADARIDTLSIPDTDLYRLAKKTYLAYLEEKAALFSAAASNQAGASVADRYTLDRFEKWGELLTKYPVLLDFIAISNGNTEEALKKIGDVR